MLKRVTTCQLLSKLFIHTIEIKDMLASSSYSPFETFDDEEHISKSEKDEKYQKGFEQFMSE